MSIRFCSLLTLSALLFTSLNMTSANAAKAYEWPTGTWTDLTYGLYWVKEVNGEAVYCPAQPLPGDSIPAACNPLPYNNKAPTVIFLHGWEPGSTVVHSRPELLADAFSLATPWLQKNWNIGVFYWNQFSDEGNVLDAEAKIWTADGPYKMRWMHFLADKPEEVGYSEFCPEGVPCQSAGDLLYKSYTEAMRDYQGDNVRIVGHSLGSQLAVNLSYRIGAAVKDGNLSPNLLPKRLVLLDPFYTYGYYSILNDNADFIVKHYGVIITAYLSSAVSLQSWYAGPVANYAVISRYYPSYCSYFDYMAGEVCAHSAAWWNYLLSMKDKPPVGYTKEGFKVIPVGHAASASSADEDIAQMIGANYYWAQYTGSDTLDTNDDTFMRTNYWLSSGAKPSAAKVKAQTELLPYKPVRQLKAMNLTKQPGLIALINENQIEISMRSLPENRTIKLDVETYPADVTNPLILWRSSNASIAQAFSGGFIQIKRPGKVEVTATAPNNGETKVTQTYTLHIVG